MSEFNPDRIMGVDLAITRSGVTLATGSFLIDTDPQDSLHNRVRTIVEEIGEVATAGLGAMWVVEAPMLRAYGGMHLYEVGWAMKGLYDLADRRAAAILQVSSGTLRKVMLGNGNIAKSKVALAVFKRYGMEFEDDPGEDKLFAWLLWKYGVGVAEGSIEHAPAKPRGQGKHAKSAVRKRSKK